MAVYIHIYKFYLPTSPYFTLCKLMFNLVIGNSAIRMKPQPPVQAKICSIEIYALPLRMQFKS